MAATHEFQPVITVFQKLSYLGIKFNYNGSFNKCQKYLYDQASKAMYAVLNRCRNLMLPVDLQLQLFDTLVLPILLYGSEVWGPYQNAIINRLQLKFYK